MPTKTIQCEKLIAADPAAVWGLVGDFFSDWHPAVKTCEKVVSPGGGEIRRFEDQSGQYYEERLAWVSHSDQTLEYELISGIDGIERYIGRVELEAKKSGANLHSHVTWSAEITASDDRLNNIAIGTEAIFQQGLEFLEAYPFAEVTKPSGIAAVSKEIALVDRVDIKSSPRLSYLSARKPNADTLVLFLHGIGGNAENWMPQLEAFGESFNLAAMDFRGYGQSSLGDAQTVIEDHCNDILKVFREGSEKRLILVGLSMGSWIATSFAMRYPRLLEGLVLAGGCKGMSEAPTSVREDFRKSRSQPLLAGKTMTDVAPQILKVICGPHAPKSAVEALRRSMVQISKDTYFDALNCFCRPVETFDFAKITCPVLLVTGEHDLLAPPDEIREVARSIHRESEKADIRFEVIGEAGHVCNLEKPLAFNAILQNFLSRFKGASSVVNLDRRGAKREAKRQRILDASLHEFCQNGFEGASMSAIGDRAGVSKPTLYKYFGDKDALFTAVLEQGRTHLLAPLIVTDGDLVDCLWSFSWNYADFVLREDMLALARLILGEAARHPKSAEAYYRAGPNRTLSGLVQFINHCEEDGLLDVEDTELAAQHLWSLILSGPRDHHLHLVNKRPDESELLQSITNGLRVFLKAYSTRTDADIKALTKKFEEKRDELSDG